MLSEAKHLFYKQILHYVQDDRQGTSFPAMGQQFQTRPEEQESG